MLESLVSLQGLQDVNMSFNTPGRPSPQTIRKSIDFGDKIGSESIFVCYSLGMWPLGQVT